MFCHDVDRKRNGGRLILKEDRISPSLKLEIKRVMLNVIGVYEPQVGCQFKEKD